MDETKIEEQFNQLEKRVTDGFLRMETLIETFANTCAREFASIAERFTAFDERFVEVDKRFDSVDERLNTIEGSIEAFSQRVDSEVEERHQLAERIVKLEKAI